MPQPTPFRYLKTGQPCVTRDMRKKHEKKIARDHCYFVGFRVTLENEMRYQHSQILADDYEALIAGIDEERRMILKRQLATAASDIEPVFVRNLLMHEANMIDSIEKIGISSEIQKTLLRRDDHRFTVLGRSGNEQIYLAHENAQDALTAMRLTRLHNINLAAKDFQPLDVRHAHPAAKEFDSLFHQVADGFMKLVGDSYRAGYVN